MVSRAALWHRDLVPWRMLTKRGDKAAGARTGNLLVLLCVVCCVLCVCVLQSEYLFAIGDLLHVCELVQ